MILIIVLTKTNLNPLFNECIQQLYINIQYSFIIQTNY